MWSFQLTANDHTGDLDEGKVREGKVREEGGREGGTEGRREGGREREREEQEKEAPETPRAAARPERTELAAALSSALLLLVLDARRGAGAQRGFKLDLADAHVLGRDLDALVFASELEALFESELARRGH